MVPSFKYIPTDDDADDIFVYCRLNDDCTDSQCQAADQSSFAFRQPDKVRTSENSALNDNQRLLVNLLIVLGVTDMIVFNIWPASFPNGCGGADICIVVCGFLAAVHYAKSSVSSYYMSLVRQVVLVHVVVLLVILLVVNSPYVRLHIIGDDSPLRVLPAMFFVTNLFTSGHSITAATTVVLEHIWLPSLLVQFYIFVPLLFHCLGVYSMESNAMGPQLKRWRWILFAALALSSFVYYVVLCVNVYNNFGKLFVTEDQATRLLLFSMKPLDSITVNTFARFWQFSVGFALAVHANSSLSQQFNDGLTTPRGDIESNDAKNALRIDEKSPLKSSTPSLAASSAVSPCFATSTDEPNGRRKSVAHFQEVDLSGVAENPTSYEPENIDGGLSERLHCHVVTFSLLIVITLMPMTKFGYSTPVVFLLRYCVVGVTTAVLYTVVGMRDDGDATSWRSAKAVVAFVSESTFIWYIVHWPIVFSMRNLLFINSIQGSCYGMIGSLLLAVAIRRTIIEWTMRFESVKLVLGVVALFYTFCLIVIGQSVYYLS